MPNAFLQRLARSCSQARLGNSPAGRESSSGAARLPWIPSPVPGTACADVQPQPPAAEAQEKAEGNAPAIPSAAHSASGPEVWMPPGVACFLWVCSSLLVNLNGT